MTHIVVRADLLGRDRLDVIARTASLQPVTESGDMHIYRLREVRILA